MLETRENTFRKPDYVPKMSSYFELEIEFLAPAMALFRECRAADTTTGPLAPST